MPVPLNVIRLALANCKREIKSDAPRLDILAAKMDRIDGQVQRASAIIEHMRMFGREASESFAPISAVKALKGALLLLREQLRLSEIEIDEHYPDCDEGTVLGHEIQLEQVIINLITNAKDALNGQSGKKDKQIRLSVSVNQDIVSIVVEDNGGGVPGKIVSRIFEPFFTTKDVGSGTGLGLSVSYGIIKDMGGELSIVNTGGGARFLITLSKSTRPGAVEVLAS